MTPTLNWSFQLKKTIDNVKERGLRMASCMLSYRQKLHFVKTVILPAATYAFPLAYLIPADLAKLDRLYSRICKQAMGLPTCTPTAMIFEDREKGGLRPMTEDCNLPETSAYSPHPAAKSASVAPCAHQADSMLGVGTASIMSYVADQAARAISDAMPVMATPFAVSKDGQAANSPEQTLTVQTQPCKAKPPLRSASSGQLDLAGAPRVRRAGSCVSFAAMDLAHEVELDTHSETTDHLDGLGSYNMIRQHSQAISVVSQDQVKESSPPASVSSSFRCRTLSQVELEALSTTPSMALADADAQVQPMSAWNKARAYLGQLADMELHVTLEYSVPHLGHNSSLMYGGLGKMVVNFVRCTDVPIAVCAPMYAAFYKEGGNLDQLQLLLSFELQVGSTVHKVDVFSTVCKDRVAYFSLQADIFRTVERDTIHSFAR